MSFCCFAANTKPKCNKAKDKGSLERERESLESKNSDAVLESSGKLMKPGAELQWERVNVLGKFAGSAIFALFIL